MINKTILVLLSILVLAILSGCLSEKTINTPEGQVSVKEGGTGPSWCKTGTKITVAGPQQGSFEIKGLTTHNGTEVCQAEIASTEGSMEYYFNEKNDYIVMAYKDKNGNTTQEMNLVNPKS